MWLRRPLPDTNFDLISIVMGIPFSRWGAKPFIVHPISYPEGYGDDLHDNMYHDVAPAKPAQHPVHLALAWRQMLADDNTLNMAGIARNTGVSRARVTQIMNLLDLPKEILSYVTSLTVREDIRHFSERNLRSLLARKSITARLAAFRQLRQQCPR
ncbi:MAG: hypothetical protein PHW60_03360 [Kiritimatiellae bacterium]|nr:hypothetical protein [Kiritimatiellia bacterium]